MNRYMADGMLADMRAGKRVLYLGHNLAEAAHVLGCLADRLGPGEKVWRTHGAERVESPGGGFIKLSSVGSMLRGMTVDVLVVDADPTMKRWEDIAVLCSTAEFIRT